MGSSVGARGAADDLGPAERAVRRVARDEGVAAGSRDEAVAEIGARGGADDEDVPGAVNRGLPGLVAAELPHELVRTARGETEEDAVAVDGERVGAVEEQSITVRARQAPPRSTWSAGHPRAGPLPSKLHSLQHGAAMATWALVNPFGSSDKPIGLSVGPNGSPEGSDASERGSWNRHQPGAHPRPPSPPISAPETRYLPLLRSAPSLDWSRPARACVRAELPLASLSYPLAALQPSTSCLPAPPPAPAPPDRIASPGGAGRAAEARPGGAWEHIRRKAEAALPPRSESQGRPWLRQEVPGQGSRQVLAARWGSPLRWHSADIVWHATCCCLEPRRPARSLEPHPDTFPITNSGSRRSR